LIQENPEKKIYNYIYIKLYKNVICIKILYQNFLNNRELVETNEILLETKRVQTFYNSIPVFPTIEYVKFYCFEEAIKCLAISAYCCALSKIRDKNVLNDDSNTLIFPSRLRK